MTKKFHKTSVGVLSAIMMFTCVILLTPKQTNAQSTGVTCAASGYLSGLITSYVSGLFGSEGGNVPVGDTKTHTKEFSLDRLASCAAKEALHQMTASVVGWINSGFKGSPSFLTNPQGFFIDVADNVSGQFLSKDGPLKNLCSPWSIDIRLSLALKQANSRTGSKYTCTLSTIIANAKNAKVNGNSIQGFLNGDFNQGGWDGFIALSTDSRNNPYSLYLTAYSDQLAAIGEKKAQISSDLLQGHGFMSWQKCEPVTLPSEAEEGAEIADPSLSRDSKGNLQRCTQRTPGSAIAAVLYPHLNNGRDELQLADNINSVVNALMNQMVTTMLSQGLTSLSKGGASAGSGPSYLTKVINDAKGSENGAATQAQAVVKTSYEESIRIMGETKKSFVDARTCFSTKIGSGTLSSSNSAIATSKMTEIDGVIATSIDPQLASLNTKLASSGTGSITGSQAQQDLGDINTLTQTLNPQAAQFQNSCNTLGSTSL